MCRLSGKSERGFCGPPRPRVVISRSEALASTVCFCYHACVHGHEVSWATQMKTKIKRSNRKRARTHGFRARMSSRGGRKIIKRRRRIGKKRLTEV